MTRREARSGERSLDDNAETIKKRLDVYHNQTAPLIEWYRLKAFTTTSTDSASCHASSVISAA